MTRIELHDALDGLPIASRADLRERFLALRRLADDACSREALEALHGEARGLVHMIHTPASEQTFGPGPALAELRDVALDEFGATAREINLRARQLGTEPDFQEVWEGVPCWI